MISYDFDKQVKKGLMTDTDRSASKRKITLYNSSIYIKNIKFNEISAINEEEGIVSTYYNKYQWVNFTDCYM